MNANNFYELLVSKKSSIFTEVLKYGVFVALVVLIIASFFFSPIAFLIMAIITAVYYIFIFPKFEVEYEYTLVDSSLTIDEIYSKKKRKHLMDIRLGDAELIAPYPSSRLERLGNAKKVDCSSRDPESRPLAIVCRDSGTLQCVLIQADDKLKELIKRYAFSKYFED